MNSHCTKLRQNISPQRGWGGGAESLGSQNHDVERDEKLLEYGFKILRFKAIEIKDQLNRVIKEIEASFK